MFNMAVFLVFGLFAVLAWAHHIEELQVPQYADPRHPAQMSCRFTSQPSDPALHSVKWYRGNDEIFRYTPGQTPTTRSFNSTHSSVTGTCTQDSCSISVRLPLDFNAKIPFTCEVSSEGPRFAVVKETKDLTIAVVLKEDPVITGVPGSVQAGEDLTVNCSTGSAMPAASLRWLIDGKPKTSEDPSRANSTVVSATDALGLRRSWRSLRFRAETSKGQIAVACEASQPTQPVYTRTAHVTIIVARSPHLSMFTASGSSTVEGNGILTAVYMMVQILFSNYSALWDIASMLL